MKTTKNTPARKENTPNIRSKRGGTLLTNSRNKIFAVIALALIMSVCFVCVALAEGGADDALAELNGFVPFRFIDSCNHRSCYRYNKKKITALAKVAVIF